MAVDFSTIEFTDDYVRENMAYGEYMNRRFHGWGFAKLYAQIRYKAPKKGDSR